MSKSPPESPRSAAARSSEPTLSAKIKRVYAKKGFGVTGKLRSA